MGLQKQVVQVPLLGLDTHSDPKNAPPGSYELSENEFGRRIAGGGIEWRKRFGTTSRTKNILGGGSITDGRKLVSYGNEQLLVAGSKLYSWSSVAGAWIDRGNLSPIGLSTVAVAGGLNDRSAPDEAVGGGYRCVVNRDGAVAHATVIDLTTGATVLNDQDLGMGATAKGAHVVALSSVFMIFAMGNSGANITAVSIAYATPSTVSAVTSVATNASTTAQRWDVVRYGTADQALICYNGDAANRLRVILWNSNMTSAGALLFGEQPDGAIGWLDHDYLNGHAYLAYIDSTRGTKVLDITVSGFGTAATLLDPAVTTGDRVTGYRTGGVNTVFVERPDASGFEWLRKTMYSTGGAALADYRLGLSIWSRAFRYTNGSGATSFYMVTSYDDGLQDKYFVLDVTTSTGVLVGNALDGNGFGTQRLPSFLSSVPAVSATAFEVPVHRFKVDVLGSSLIAYELEALKLEFSPTLSKPRQIGASLVFPGASVRTFAGGATAELGFPLFPKNYSVVQSATGGLAALATYSFCTTYFWVDERGQEWESAPSDPLTVTLTGANNAIAFSTTMLRIGSRTGSTAPLVRLYMTKASGTTYYLIRDEGNNQAVNSTTTFGATSGPAGDEPELYTTGRVLPHNAPPPANLIEVWGDRAFLAQTDAPGQLWASDEIAEGEGLTFSQVNVLALPSEDGEVSTINEFDDRLVIGKLGGALYPLSGSGPAANGDGQYQTPSRINSVVGPIGPNGVIKTSAGLIFTSLHGRYLLPRGGADPVRLAKIEGYDSLTVTGASNVDGYEQTRLVTAEGRTLVYHYGLPDETGIGHWSTFTGQAAVDCANFGGTWCYLSSDGTVHVEVAGQYADDGVALSRTSRFNWLAGGGTFGNIRLYAAELLGEVLANCTITATVAYDFDATIIDTRTEAVTVGTKGALELRPSRGRSTAVQFAISETSSGEGYRLTALAVEIGAKPGFAKKAAAAFLT